MRTGTVINHTDVAVRDDVAPAEQRLKASLAVHARIADGFKLCSETSGSDFDGHDAFFNECPEKTSNTL